ncbi:uncharacterized protein [Henckelia pumila]|uniref:uncharacterized protein n=1 Tax=Henckelia pumila TaxID=405737 RepID=UPI003C6E2B4A
MAIKKQIVHGLSTSSLREIGILRSLVCHPWFVEFKQVVVDGCKGDDDHVYVVMEFVENDLRLYMDGMAWAFAEAKVKVSVVQGPEAARSWRGEIFMCRGYVVRWVYYERDVAEPSAFQRDIGGGTNADDIKKARGRREIFVRF